MATLRIGAPHAVTPGLLTAALKMGGRTVRLALTSDGPGLVVVTGAPSPPKSPRMAEVWRTERGAWPPVRAASLPEKEAIAEVGRIALSAQSQAAEKAGASMNRGAWKGSIVQVSQSSIPDVPALAIQLERDFSTYARLVVRTTTATAGKGAPPGWSSEVSPRKNPPPAWFQVTGDRTGTAPTLAGACAQGLQSLQRAVIQPSCALRDMSPPSVRPVSSPAQKGRKEPLSYIYDAQGRRYQVKTIVEACAVDGSGPIVASHLPGGGKVRGYPQELQSRDLDAAGELDKIRTIARDLDPYRVLVAHGDPTLGPPVVWRADTGSGPKLYPLGGNGRTLAILSCPPDRYAAYAAEAARIYPKIWPKKPAPEGKRWIVVREVLREDGGPLDLPAAVVLAGASQASTAGVEGPIGRALSVARGIGVSSPADLGRWNFAKHLDRDTLPEARKQNRAWFQALLQKVEKSKRSALEDDAGALVDLAESVFVAGLPVEVQRSGFGSEAEERAFMGALPALWTLHQEVEAGEIPAQWDLWPQLAPAAAAAKKWRNKTPADAIKEVEDAADQVSMFSGRSIFDELKPLGVVLALALKKAAATRDPARAIENYLRLYRGCSGEDDTCDADTRGKGAKGEKPPAMAALGLAYDAPDPAQVLAGIIGTKLPKKSRA